ncbi:unnamed protein product [Urochloa humidicola]
MAPAATAQPAAPAAFSFLTRGVVLPATRPGLFLRLFAMNAALSAAVHLFGVLLMAPLGLDAAVNPQDNLRMMGHGGAEFSVSRLWLLTGGGAAYLALYLLTWLVRKVAAACAAVAACSGGERRVSLLRMARGGLARVSAAVALGAVLRASCAAAAAAAALAAPPLALYLTRSPRLALLAALLAALAIRFCFHLEAVCAMAVVVAAAEPGETGGSGAVARAWRLMRGTGGSALAYVVATWALEMAAGPVRDLAVGRLLPSGTDGVVVLVVGACLKYVVNFVVDVISMTSIAAYYFECRKKEDDEKEKAGHID